MNHDRIADVYEGRFGDPHFQSVARQRIHWLCSQAGDGRVLDLGCSQGIASILLARAGRTVVGVDREAAAIETANQLAERETEGVRGRLSFRLAEGMRLPFKAGSFGSVLLGEVLEHQTNPARLVKSAVRMLAPGGRLVVTVPYGLFRYHDHKTTMFAEPLVSALERVGEVIDIELIDRYLGAVAVKGDPTPASSEVMRRAVRAADARVDQLDRALDELAAATRETTAAAREQLDRTVAALKIKADHLEADLTESRHLERKARSDAEMCRVALDRAEAERDELAHRVTSAGPPSV